MGPGEWSLSFCAGVCGGCYGFCIGQTPLCVRGSGPLGRCKVPSVLRRTQNYAALGCSLGGAAEGAAVGCTAC